LDVWGEGPVDDQLLGFNDGWNNQASVDAQDDSPYYKGAYGVGSIYAVLASRQYWEGVGQGVAITAGVCATVYTLGLAVEAGAVLWAARAAGPVTAATMAAQRASQNGLAESVEALALPPGAAPSRPSGSALLPAEGRTAQAAGKTAAKESVEAANKAQETGRKLKAVEEAKKCPCPEEAGGLIIGKPADLISPNVRKFMDGEKQLSDLSAGEIADAIRGYGEFADLAKNDVHKAYQQARIKALKGESPSPGKLLDFMKNYDNTGK
jgi:hypothetical protein